MNTEEIIRNVKNPLTDEVLNEIINRTTTPNEPFKITYQFYNNLVNPNHNEYKLNVNETDKLNFTVSLFNTWKNNITSLTEDVIKKYIEQGIYNDSIYYLRNYLKTLPDKISAEQFYKVENNLFQIMNNDYDEVKKYGWRKTDANYWTKIYFDDVVGKRTNYINSTKHRLYMNINEKDLYKLSYLFVQKCYERKVDYSFKFSTIEKREDGIVFFASDKNLPKYLEILNEIKKERPEIFERCEKPPILTGLLDEKIGYGAEPTERIKNENDDLASFNTLRSKILEDSINETYKKWIIDNSEKKYIIYNNKQILLGDYIIYRYAKAKYEEYLDYSGKYSKYEIKSLEFQKELLQAYQDNRKWVINQEGYFQSPKFTIPLPINLKNLEKDILRNIVSKDPNYLKQLKEKINEKCIQYDIDPENFAINMGKEKLKNIEESVKKEVENTKQKIDTIYNNFIEKIKNESEEKDLLKEFSETYQEFVNKINVIGISTSKEIIEKYKMEIISKIKVLYSDYYLKLQDLKSKDNFEQKKNTLPTFEELKKLKDKYEIKNTEHFEHKIVIEKETGKQVTDSKLINNVNFAYLWKYAAQIKVFANDDEGYAFNNITEESYKFFINEIMKQIKETGTIDSIKLFRQSQIHSLDYKYTTEIITKLFDSKVTIKKIEEILHDRGIVENNALENVQELYGDELIATRIAQEKNNEIVYGNKVK